MEFYEGDIILKGKINDKIKLIMKRKTLIKTIALMLSVVMLFTGIPFNLITWPTLVSAEEIYIVEEVEKLRSEYSKTYKRSDGNLETILSSVPLHYKKDDQWLEIDNSLKLENENYYTNEDNKYVVKLPTSSVNNAEILMNYESNDISIKLLDSNVTKAKKEKKNKNKSSENARKKMSADELVKEDIIQVDSIEYNDIFNDTDVRYDVGAAGLKESIIINKKPNKSISFKYFIQSNNLTAILNNDKSVNFYKKTDTKYENLIFYIPAPYMFDKENNYSYNIDVSLEKSGNGYLMTYTPDIKWLKEKDRIYPVTLDPTVYMGSPIHDTYTFSETSYRDTVLGFEEQLKVGSTNWLTGGTFDTYIRFENLPQIPEGYNISNAYLNLTTINGRGNDIGVSAYQITSGWTNKRDDENQLTYNNRPTWDESPTDAINAINSYQNDCVTYSWNITRMVRKWMADPSTNWGVRLDGSGAISDIIFQSSRNISAKTFSPPNISIVYGEIDRDVYNGMAAERDIDMGQAGIVSVNDFTGNLKITRNDIGTEGILPVNIYMQFDTQKRNEESVYGNGWRTNYSQTLIHYPEEPYNYYIYTSADGSAIRFERDLKASTSSDAPRDKIYVSDNSQYTLFVGNNISSPGQAYIKDQDGRKYYFNNSGQLIKIVGNYRFTNFDQTLSYIAESDGNKAYYLLDLKDKKIKFEQDVETSNIKTDTERTKIFINKSGTGDILYVGNNVTSVTSAYVEDESGLRYYFNENGSLKNVTEGETTYNEITASSPIKQKGAIDISYTNNGNIDKIHDGTGREYQFHYNSDSSKLAYIDYCGNNNIVYNRVEYTYFNGSIYEIYYYSRNNNELTKHSTISYNYFINKAISSIKNSDNSRLDLSYTTTSGDNPLIYSIKEIGPDEDTVIQDVSVRLQDNTTTYSDSISNAKEIITFDDHGNVLSITDGEGNGYFNEYENSSNGTEKLIVRSSHNQQSVVNYIKDPIANGDDPFDDFIFTVGGEVDNTEKKFGNSSIKLSTPNLGAYPSFKQINITLKPDTDYVFSVYVKTTGDVHPYLDTDGSEYYSWEEPTDIDGWKRMCIAYKSLSSNYRFYNTVYIGLKNTDTGAIYCDGFQIEEGTRPSRLNIMPNGNFSDTDDELWNLAQGEIDNMEGHDDNSSVKISGSSIWDGNKFNVRNVYQDIKITGAKGDQYSFGGWGKSDAMISSVFEIRAQFFNGNVALGNPAVAKFNPTLYDWQYTMSGITAPGPYTKIRISIYFDNNRRGYGNFDDIQLYRQSFGVEYDNTEETSTSEGNDYLTEVSTSKNYPTSNNKYDKWGNCISSIISNDRFSMETNYTYNADGNYVSSLVNQLGQTMNYDYNADTGILESITDPNNVKQEYTYNNRGKWTSVSRNVTGLYNGDSMSINYEYDSGNRLKKITNANGVSYSYNYNGFGKIQSILMGTNELITYNYDNDSRLLKSKTYDNGQSIFYKYDSNGNVISTGRAENTSDYIFYYGEDSMVGYKDNVNKINTAYKYDEYGNQITEQKGFDGCTYSHDYSYIGNKLSETINDKTYNVNYTVSQNGRNNGAVWEIKNNLINNYEVYYDDLDRISSSSIYTKSGETTTPILNTSYAYNDVAGFKTSEQIFAMSTKSAKGYENQTIYSYDKLGFITKAGDITYSYDEAGQLVRVNDPKYGTTVYTYDSGGNIRSSKTYDYTVGEVGNVKGTKTFYYGADNRLINYNGGAIVYDGADNPTIYKGMNFTWDFGRRLSTAKVDGKNISFSYGSDGLRLRKKVGGTTTDFTWVDRKLTSQTSGNNTMYFVYDYNNQLLGFSYNNSEYYYVKNLQGDIIAIIDGQGNCIAEYDYDAYGKLLSVTDGNGNDVSANSTHIANVNPMRYRGYYYDTETGFYYLQNRYYDPEIGRFINADAPEMARAVNNLFTYCANNPVMFIDLTGEFIGGILLLGGMFLGTVFLLSGCSEPKSASTSTQSTPANPNKTTSGSNGSVPSGAIYTESGSTNSDSVSSNIPSKGSSVVNSFDKGYISVGPYLVNELKMYENGYNSISWQDWGPFELMCMGVYFGGQLYDLVNLFNNNIRVGINYINYNKGQIFMATALDQSGDPGLRICMDGFESKDLKLNDRYGDTSFKSETTLFGNAIAADAVPYIVIPYSLDDPRSLKPYLASVGVIINEETGDYLYCVVADNGDIDKRLGEVSIYAAAKMTNKTCSQVGNYSQNGHYTIMLFQTSAPSNNKDDRYGWYGKTIDDKADGNTKERLARENAEKLNEQIIKEGQECFRGYGRCLNYE